MENIEKNVKRIRIFATISLSCCLIVIVLAIIRCMESSSGYIALFSALVSGYIIDQIYTAAGEHQESYWKEGVILLYVKRIAYACFVEDIGASIIQMIVYTLQKGRLHLSLHVTGVGIGILLLVSIEVYRYGCAHRRVEETQQ